MTTRVNHLLVTLSTSTLLAACQTQDPCAENPESIFCPGDEGTGDTSTGTGDSTGGLVDDECVPFDDPNDQGYGFACQGTGNGWLEISVNPVGAQPTECVNWGDQGKPDNPTSDDCVPLALDMLPNGIPSPGACCLEEADAASIEDQCIEDCAYAACKLAVQKLRDAAMALPMNGAQGVVRDDLFALASLLELPEHLKTCVEDVQMGDGEVVAIPLGAGVSAPSEFGHVESATLHLQCELDEQVPFVATELACDAPPNIPMTEGESNMTGVAAAGSITVFGPGGQSSAGLSDVAFEFTETVEADGSRSVRLTRFSAEAETASHGSFTVIDPSLELASPASGRLAGESVQFPAGALRVRVSAGVTADGQPLFGGRPTTSEYVNTEVATAVRSVDGSFAFTEAPFEVGDYLFVLNTEAGAFEPR